MLGVDLVDIAGRIPPRPAWMADAACREHPEVNFFPTAGEDVEPAKAVCAGCLVNGECKAYARAERIPAGVWAGEGGRARMEATSGVPRRRSVSQGARPDPSVRRRVDAVDELARQAAGWRRAANAARAKRAC